MKKTFCIKKNILDDTYPYGKKTREFQFDKIKHYLGIIDSIQDGKSTWGVVQNRRNINGKAPLVKEPVNNDYKRYSDKWGVEQSQSVPLYSLNDTETPERYTEDGSLIKFTPTDDKFATAEPIYITGNWMIPEKYIRQLKDSTVFTKVIVVDRTNQNIATFEKVNSKWLVRSMDNATTGLHHPPLQKETPLGIFVIQEKNQKCFIIKMEQLKLAALLLMPAVFVMVRIFTVFR